MTPASRWITFALALTLALFTRTHAQGNLRPIDPPAPELQFTPAALDLGDWAAGGDVSASAWLINTGDRPLTLAGTTVEANGLALEPIRPGPIPPAGVREFRVTITAPATVDASRTRSVKAYIKGRSPMILPVSVRAIHPDVHLPPPPADQHAGSIVRAAPAQLDFGPAAPGERVHRSIWLINAGDTPVQLNAARGSCGCVDFERFDPVTIAPQHATELEPSMVGQGEIGSERFKYATFIFENQHPLAVELHMQIVDPKLSKLRRFLAARDRNDTAGMRVCLSLDSRIWRDRRAGPGVQRNAEGEGPIAAWNRTLNAIRRYDDFTVDGDEVTVTVTETNDFIRLLGRAADVNRQTYIFNADREIDGVVIARVDSDASPTTTLLKDAVAWARINQPRMLDAIYPDGRFIPSAANAHRWRKLLIEWRRATGRAAVDLGVGSGAAWSPP